MTLRNLLFPALLLALLLSACEKNPANDDHGDDPTTMPQEHIPWPSLADSPWPMFMHDPQHTGRSPYEGPSQGEVNWELPLDREVFSNPVIDMKGNILFTGRSDLHGQAKLYSASSAGDLNWEQDLGGNLDSSPLITSDSLIYVAFDGYLAQLDLNGNFRWKYTFEGPSGYSRNSPNISRDGGTIYVCGFDRALYAIKRDGTLRWKYSIDPAESWGEPSISPDGNTIYFVGSDFTLYAVDTDGTLNWRMPLAATQGSITTPVIDSEGNLYLYAGLTMYAISPEGTIRWQYGEMKPGSSFYDGCSIGPDGTLYATRLWSYYAFDYAGNLKWELWLQDKYVRIFNLPVVDRLGNTYFGTVWTGPNHDEWYNVNFVSFDPEGSARYKILLGPTINGLDIDSPACIDGNGNLYVGSDAGNPVAVFSIR